MGAESGRKVTGLVRPAVGLPPDSGLHPPLSLGASSSAQFPFPMTILVS